MIEGLRGAMRWVLKVTKETKGRQLTEEVAKGLKSA